MIDVPTAIRGDLTDEQLEEMDWDALWETIVQRAVDSQSQAWRDLHVDGGVPAVFTPFSKGWTGIYVDGDKIAVVEWRQLLPSEDPKTTVL